MGADSGRPLLGGGIASRVARVAADATVYSRQKMVEHNRLLVARTLEDFFALTGFESRTTIGPLLVDLLDIPDADPHAKRLLDFVARGEGQLATMLGNTIIGTAAGVGLGTLLSNLFQPLTGRLIATQPHLPISPADAARAQATGKTHGLDARFEAAQQGIDSRGFDILADLATQELDPSTILDLLNRGRLNEDFARGLL